MMILNNNKYELLIEKDIIDFSINQTANLLDSYIDNNTIFIVVMNGGAYFSTKVFEKINKPIEIYYVKLSSYFNNKQTNLNVQQDSIELLDSLKGKKVVLVDEFVDSGKTIMLLYNKLKQTNYDVKVCSLLKRHTFKEKLFINNPIEITDDSWLLGCGLDDNNCGRNLNAIYKKIN